VSVGGDQWRDEQEAVVQCVAKRSADQGALPLLLLARQVMAS